MSQSDFLVLRRFLVEHRKGGALLFDEGPSTSGKPATVQKLKWGFSFAPIGLQFTIKVNPAEEGGFWAQCVEIPGALSEGETVDETVENVSEALGMILKTEGMTKNFTVKYFVSNERA
jgi:predicted RNase H-like HicB family nuclease